MLSGLKEFSYVIFVNVDIKLMIYYLIFYN